VDDRSGCGARGRDDAAGGDVVVNEESHKSGINQSSMVAEDHCVATDKHESDPSPREVAIAGAVALREIDERTKQDTEALLSAMLCAAWPTLRAQNQ
jgi:hypothetical protein